MPKRLPKGKVGLYLYVRPEYKDFIKSVVLKSREENGCFRSMGVLIETLVNSQYQKEFGNNKILDCSNEAQEEFIY